MLRLIACFFAAVIAAPAAGAERLVVQLAGGWGPEHAGFALAQSDGLYLAEGLEVTFRPGLTLDPLIRGEVELAVEHAAPALFARRSGAELVNIAQIVRRPTATIVCAGAAGVAAPADLRAQVFVRPPSGQEPALALALAALGVTEPRYAADAPCRLARSFLPQPEGTTAFPLEAMGIALLEEGVWGLDFALQEPAFAGRATRFLRASLEGWARFARDPKAAPGLVAALGRGELGRMDEAAFLTTARLLMLGWIRPVLDEPPEGAWRDDLRAATARPASAAPPRARGR